MYHSRKIYSRLLSTTRALPSPTHPATRSKVFMYTIEASIIQIRLKRPKIILGLGAVVSDVGQGSYLLDTYPSGLLLTPPSSLPTNTFHSFEGLLEPIHPWCVLQSPNLNRSLNPNHVPSSRDPFHQSTRLSTDMSLRHHLKTSHRESRPILAVGLANGKMPRGSPTQPPPLIPTFAEALCIIEFLLGLYLKCDPYPSPPPTPPPQPPPYPNNSVAGYCRFMEYLYIETGAGLGGAETGQPGAATGIGNYGISI